MKNLKNGSLLCCLIVFVLTASSQASAQTADNCGRPDFDRNTDRGFFIWQDCPTGDWFFRATNGGTSSEFTVEGRLRLSSDIQEPEPFNLNNIGVQDIFDFSDPQNVRFRFRVFSIAQDGIDFRLAPDTKACLFVRTSDGSPIIVGRNNVELRSPLNMNTLSGAGCVVVEPFVFLLTDDD